MSAIEMMDPKMDAGMMCNQIQRKVLTFDSALEVYIWLLEVLYMNSKFKLYRNFKQSNYNSTCIKHCIGMLNINIIGHIFFYISKEIC